MTDTQIRYSKGAMLFHWTIAVAVIVNWRIAEAAEHAAGPEKGAIFANHKALGIVILALTIGRLLWRWTHPRPPLADTVKPWEKVLAKVVHTTFYILLIGLPLGAWIANSLTGRAIDMFGLFTIPPLPVGENEGLGGSIFDAHKLGGTLMLYLIALHILAALKHTFIDRDGQIFRMLPFGTPKA